MVKKKAVKKPKDPDKIIKKMKEIKKEEEKDSFLTKILNKLKGGTKKTKHKVMPNNGGKQIHPDQAQKEFFHDVETMKHHLDQFLQQDDFEEKLESCLNHITNSDYDEDRKDKVKEIFNEVMNGE